MKISIYCPITIGNYAILSEFTGAGDDGLDQPMERDAAYKNFFADPVYVEQLLRHFLREPWVGGADMSTLVREDPQHSDRELRRRANDMLWRVRCPGLETAGPDSLVYVHLMLEFQSGVDYWMSLRMLNYVGMLYERLARRGVKWLPPVVPLVLYSGRPPWTARRNVRDLVRPDLPQSGRAAASLEYALVDVHRCAPLENAEGNLVEAVFRVERASEPGQIADAGRIVISGAKSVGAVPDTLKAFADWIAWHVLPERFPTADLTDLRQRLGRFEDPLERMEMIADYEFNIGEKILQRGRAEGRQEGRAEGRQEGRAEGRQEGRAESLYRIVETRFGRPVADELASVLRGLPGEPAADEMLSTAAVCESGEALLARARVLATPRPPAS